MKLFSSKIFQIFVLIIAAFMTSLFFQNCSKLKSFSGGHQVGNYSLNSEVNTAVDPANSMFRQNRLDNDSSTDIDHRAPDCTAAVLSGYKCLDQKITTSEGKTYGVRLKWNRANKTSRGSFISVGGGAGVGEALDDSTFKKIVEKLDTQDQVRAIFIEFTDAPGVAKEWGGCWSRGGGYRSAGLLFRDVIKKVVDELKIPRGSFLNYLGLSNGTMLISYGMSTFDMDRYFNRVVMHAGPVMPDAKAACDQNNSKSIYAVNTKERADYLVGLFSLWLNGDGGANMCANIQNDDRMSILSGKRNFSDTEIVTVIGNLEDKPGGFGGFHKISNEDWFNKISAKSKLRLVPEFMGHTYGYSHLRRFLKAGKNEAIPNDVHCPDQITEVCEAGTLVKHVRLACTISFTDYIMQGAGYQKVETDHYKISMNKSCDTAPVNPAPQPVAPAPPPKKSFKFIGAFFGDGTIITRRDHKIIGAGPHAKVCLGRYSVNANACVNESDFVFLRDRLGVGGYYDSGSDTYFVSENLSAYRFPYEKYYAVFILSDGTRQRVELQPIYEYNFGGGG